MTLLIFDCDGVLTDSEILHAQIESEIGKEMLGINLTPLEHNAIYSGGGLKMVYDAWEKETGKPLPPAINDEIIRRKNEAFSTRLQVIPHVTEALAALADMPRCVASSMPAKSLEISLRSTNLFPLFAPHIFSVESVKRSKPAPDLFLYAAEQMGAAPKECIVIEDSTLGVQAGMAANMEVIGFTGGSHCLPGHAEKLRGAVAICDNMLGLPNIIRSLSDGY